MARTTGRRGRRRRKGSGQSQPRAAAASAPRPQAQAQGQAQAASVTVPPPQTLLRPRRETPNPSVVSAPARQSRRLFGFFRIQFISDILSELQKVVWPSRLETRNLSLVVIVVAVAVGVLLGVVDWGFNRILENVLLP